jgi:AraC-like DNA-binding protein
MRQLKESDIQARGLTQSYFRRLSALAASAECSPVRHPAGDSTLTALPCGGFKVSFDPSVAQGFAEFRLLTPNFVLGIIDCTLLKPIQHDYPGSGDPKSTLIFISVSSSSPTPWEERTAPARECEPQTLAGVLNQMDSPRLPPRLGTRMRAVTMSTLAEDSLGEFAPCLQLAHGYGDQLEAGGASFRIAATDKAVIQVARQMFSNPFSGAVLEAYLRAKAVEILCLMRNAHERKGPSTDLDTIREACARIDSMLSEPLDIGAIAESMHLSLRSLVRKFKAETGMTLCEYQRTKRLALAANLLLTTKLPVTQIGGDVGFSETASFSRAFTRHFSLSPSAFRRAAQN